MTSSPAATIVQQQSTGEAHRLAHEALQQKNYDLAEQYLDAALGKNRKDAVALSLMADVYVGRSDIATASQFMVLAIKADAENIEHKKKFLRLAGAIIYKKYDPAIEYAVLNCLETPNVEFEYASMLWASTLLSMPFFGQLYSRVCGSGFTLRRFFPSKENPFNNIQDFRPLLYPYFLLGSQKIVVPSLQFEQFMVFLRMFLQKEANSPHPKFSTEDYLALVTSVAHYSFHTDYILDVTEPEQQAIDTLRARIETNDGTSFDTASIALLACYVPLHSLKNAEIIGKHLSNVPVMATLLQEQIGDYVALQRHASAIIALTPIDNASKKVKTQYEDFPYPRWRELTETSGAWSKSHTTCLSAPGATALGSGLRHRGGI